MVVTNYCTGRCSQLIRSSWLPAGSCLRDLRGGNERFGKPSNPDFLLHPGELLELCAAGCVCRLRRSRNRAAAPRDGPAHRRDRPDLRRRAPFSRRQTAASQHFRPPRKPVVIRARAPCRAPGPPWAGIDGGAGRCRQSSPPSASTKPHGETISNNRVTSLRALGVLAAPRQHDGVSSPASMARAPSGICRCTWPLGAVVDADGAPSMNIAPGLRERAVEKTRE